MHIIKRKELNSAELETVWISMCPTSLITANGEVQTHEEATVYVVELDMFLTVKIQEATAVLSLGKLCEDHDVPRVGQWSEARSHQKMVFG